jgi:hypothetical protein
LLNTHEAGCCGDFCGKCPDYPDQCAGCIPTDHMDCYFVKCCVERSLEHCGFCGDFPCKRLRDFVPDDRPGCAPGYHIEELRRRKTVGTETWLGTQREKWKDLC